MDTFGGSIVTEWHQVQTSLDERFKLTIFIIGRELRSDAVKVHALMFKKATKWNGLILGVTNYSAGKLKT